MNNAEYLAFAKQLALKAGDTMLHYFDQKNIKHKIKADTSMVTIADEEINQMVIDEVAKITPDFSVDGEKGGHKKDSEYVWVCDPIDGTNPFARGIPISVFSIALVHDGVPIIGVVYDPFTKRMYTAIKGEGAYENDQPLQVDERGFEKWQIINIDTWPGSPYDLYQIGHDLILEQGSYVLAPGSAIQCGVQVARGTFIASLFAGTDEKNVDIAALKVIVEEAGGTVTDLFGNEQRYDEPINGAIVSNGIVHDELVAYCKQHLSNLKS